jgi:NitT/TauT family transport system substrate-binding protein
MKLKTLFLTSLAALVCAANTFAKEPIKIGYSDWPGWVAWEVAKEKVCSKNMG